MGGNAPHNRYGAPGTVYIQSEIGPDRISDLWIDNSNRQCRNPVRISLTTGKLTGLYLMRSACADQHDVSITFKVYVYVSSASSKFTCIYVVHHNVLLKWHKAKKI